MWLTGRGTTTPLVGAGVALVASLVARQRGLAIVLAIACAATAGVGVGVARVAAIDAGALELEPGDRVSDTVAATAPARRHARALVQDVEGAAGRFRVELPRGAAPLEMGELVEVGGRAREVEEWERAALEREGVRAVVVARTTRQTGRRRGGVAGAIDSIRRRSERALSDGVAAKGSELLRAFVLGQRAGIEDQVSEEFRRSGLAHLLAVSGTNVMLLVLLVSAMLGVVGVPLMPRLATVALVVCLYVPVAGAGPSIQRAGIMGLAGIAALAASRPLSRWYALALAAALTLALDPRAIGTVGWQLSFAAVAGIAAVAAPMAELVAPAARASRPRRAVAEGMSLTLAATLATAPFMALHFGRLSLTGLAANLLALPAVAPVMWLGMGAAMLGQLWPWGAWLVAQPAAWTAGWIGSVAGWLGGGEWAVGELELTGAQAAVLAGGLAAVAVLLKGRFVARAGLAPAIGRGMRRRGLLGGATALIVALALLLPVGGGVTPAPADGGLVMRFLDVGQGDAILIEPPSSAPVLVDAGPPWQGARGHLERLGVGELGALLVTHADEDHAGGVLDLVAGGIAPKVALGAPAPELERDARRLGATILRLERGDVVRAGEARLDVLWPPPRAPGGLADDANSLSLVLLVRWQGFRALLTGDAEAESVPLDPGPVDVLKVAHHGSRDEGLGPLLARTRPALGVIQVGDQNPYGHPVPETLAALEDAGVSVMRTDRDGEVWVHVAASGAVTVGTR